MTTMAALFNTGVLFTEMFSGTNTANVIEFFLRLNMRYLNVLEGALVVMDNHPSHHSHALTDFLRMCKAEPLFLPPATSWFNPVETVFADIKRKYRNSIHNTDLKLRNMRWMKATL